MDYEKLHKDTITKLQEMVNSGKITAEIARGICADFVPESEGERIRKTLIEAIRHNYVLTSSINHIPTKDILAWLEKQGEKDKFIEKELQCIKGYRENAIKRLEELEKQGEKNFGWSEYDEIALNRIIPTLESLKVKVKAPAYLLQDIVWLKSLKDRVQLQPKQEWSEEEQQIIKDAASFILSCVNTAETKKEEERLEELADKLQDLRPQSQWKPSGEQIMAIDTAINVLGKGTLNGKQLIELYQDLKKLKGEDI